MNDRIPTSLKMRNENIFNIIAKSFTKEISENEELTLKQWLNAGSDNKTTFERIKNIWTNANISDKEFNPDIEKAKLIFIKRVEESVNKKKIKKLWIKASQIAAIFLLVIGLSFFIKQYASFNNVVTFATTSLTKQVILPDSSLVTLNRNSQLEYHKKFNNRELTLKGEAFFEVKKHKGKPFTVLANNTKTTVLGTSFTINTQNNKTEIFVKSGKVQFSDKDETNKVYLNKNEKAACSINNRIQKNEIKDPNYLSWKTGVFYFKNQSIENVMESLTKHYHFEIKQIPENLKNYTLSCEFNKQDLDEVFEEIEFILPVRITKVNNTVEVQHLK